MPNNPFDPIGAKTRLRVNGTLGVKQEGRRVIRGACLCGSVRFELDQAVGPFELCHCSRCRKVSGSAFMAAIGVRRSDFRWVCGRELIKSYEAPFLESPPAYRVCFCSICGSCVPDPEDNSECFEIASGLLDDDPQIQPDKHIFVELKAPWFQISDVLPQLDKNALRKHRQQIAQHSVQSVQPDRREDAAPG